MNATRMKSSIVVKQALSLANQKLKKAKIDSHALDSEILLAHVLKTTKETLYTHPEKKLKASRLVAYNKLIQRRARHEPVAYLIGHKEFYGLDFLINKKVLIPRPETELMVEETLKLLTCLPVGKATNYLPTGQAGKLPTTIIDVGTGSGCIAITIAKNLPLTLPSPHGERVSEGRVRGIKFIATDISRDALKLARLNAHRHGVDKQITFLQGNLLNPFSRTPKLQAKKLKSYKLILTANLPYLPTAEWRQTMPDVKKYEPRQALDGGKDGLKYYRQLFTQLKNYSLLPTHYYLLLEICPHQAKAISIIAKQFLSPCKIEIKKDLAKRDRLAIIKLS